MSVKIHGFHFKRKKKSTGSVEPVEPILTRPLHSLKFMKMPMKFFVAFEASFVFPYYNLNNYFNLHRFPSFRPYLTLQNFMRYTTLRGGHSRMGQGSNLATNKKSISPNIMKLGQNDLLMRWYY